MSGITAIKVYGERNTGTNYVTALLDRNFKVGLPSGKVPRAELARQRKLVGVASRVSPRAGDWLSERMRDRYHAKHFDETLGWKHARIDVDRVRRRAEVGFVPMVKHPYSWAMSMQRRPYHAAGRSAGLVEFLRTPYRLVGRDGVAAPSLLPMEIWNAKVASYFALRDAVPERVVFSRYEDILVGEEDWLRQVARAFGLAEPERIARVPESTKEAAKGHDYYADYYGNERWRAELGAEACELMDSLLDRSLVARCGYRLQEQTT